MNKSMPFIIIGLCAVVIAGYLVISPKIRTNHQNIINKNGLPQSNVSPTLSVNKTTVPLPSSEDIIRLFFNLINEKKIPEAIAILDDPMIPDDSVKQQWGVNFNSLTSVTLKNIEPHSRAAWTEDTETYKVTLDIKVKPEASSAPIPNYGWDNGENTRWITLVKDDLGLWKISTIATGP